MSNTQLDLFDRPDRVQRLEEYILNLLRNGLQPSAAEFLKSIEVDVGLDARWDLLDVVTRLSDRNTLSTALREFLRSMIQDESLAIALRGQDASDRETVSSIDTLLENSRRYAGCEAFREMVDFMARFNDYAPYNNMLVRLQNPSCTFYATAKDWRIRFRRVIKEDAKPMVILAPMHPVLLVYELDQTEGEPVPKELLEFAKFEGKWDDRWLQRLVKNAAGLRILVQFKRWSISNSGFATLARADGQWKMRIVIHDQLDPPSRFGVLCHELAHILLGHLGRDYDRWWPWRTNLSRAAVEVEAEAVAWTVTTRLGLEGSSAAYVSRHLDDGKTPVGVSLDMISKTAAAIERMATTKLQAKRPRSKPASKKKPKSA